MGQAEDILRNFFTGYGHSSDYVYQSMKEIMSRRQEFEKNLDDMWDTYMSGNMRQIVEYNKGITQIKNAGLKVLRNSAGKHKIMFK